MTQHAVNKWVGRFLAQGRLRSKSVVVTIFGDSIAPHGGAIWLGSLMVLLAPFGIGDRLVRTSVFRLVQEGWLEARREGRRSLYTLTVPGLRRFEHAHRRIYALPDSHWDGSWTLLLVPNGTIPSGQRAGLRKELLWEGFSQIAPGVFAHPAANTAALEEILEDAGVRNKVFVCAASGSDAVSARPLGGLVEHCWELGSVMRGYRDFLGRFRTAAELLRSKETIDPEQSFVVRTLSIHAFRRVLLHDPQLPVELLPRDWPGTTAYDLCREIYELTYKRAEQHLVAALNREADNVPDAAPYFYERFGGLS